MAAILRVGLLTVFLTVVTANQEYTAEIADALTDYEDLVGMGAPLLEYELIKHGYKVLLSRIKLQHDKGLHFYANTLQISDGPKRRHIGKVIPSPASLELPAIEAKLKKCMKICESRCCSSSEDNPLQVFEFTEMHFRIKPNRNLKSYMHLAVEFYDSTNDQAIEVVMQVFKPPVTQANKDHSKDHTVPTIKAPIPLKELSRVSAGTESPAKVGTLNFVVDIKWLEEVLRRARFDGRKDFSTKYTELYEAGPVIIDSEVYDQIIKFNLSFQEYLS